MPGATRQLSVEAIGFCKEDIKLISTMNEWSRSKERRKPDEHQHHMPTMVMRKLRATAKDINRNQQPKLQQESRRRITRTSSREDRTSPLTKKKSSTRWSIPQQISKNNNHKIVGLGLFMGPHLLEGMSARFVVRTVPSRLYFWMAALLLGDTWFASCEMSGLPPASRISNVVNLYQDTTWYNW